MNVSTIRRAIRKHSYRFVYSARLGCVFVHVDEVIALKSIDLYSAGVHSSRLMRKGHKVKFETIAH